MATETATAPAVTTSSGPTETTKEPEGKASVAGRQDVFIYTFASGLVVFGMVLLVVSSILLVGLSVAGFPVDWGWLAVLFAFLLLFTGLFVAWYYRSMLVKTPAAKPSLPPYTPPASSYPSVGYYPQPSYSNPGYPGYSYAQNPYGYGQYGSGYAQPQAAYNPYGSYPQPAAVQAAPAAPAQAPGLAGPGGPAKSCTACGRGVPIEANFCPFCRTRL
jgi:hypothetical protein